VSIQNIVTPTSIAGSYAWTTPNGNHMPRKLPDVPVLGSLLRQLKRTTTNVKTLLIHPRNVSAVVEQLRFRYGRPEQLICSQLSGIREVPPISEHNLAKILPFATRVSNLTAFLQSAMADQN